MPETVIEGGAEQTPAPESGPANSPMDLDSLIAKHMNAGDEGQEAVPPTPTDDTETLDLDEDTPDGHQDPDLLEEDTEVEEVGGEDTGDELDVDEFDEEPLTEDEADDEVEALLAATEEEDAGSEEDTSEESFLPEFDRTKFLKEHPELEAPYKHMQAAFSKKTAEAAKVQKEAQKVRAEAEGMRAQMQEFQETLKNDDSFEEFLVEVSLNRPEVMEKAYERALALSEDEGKKEEYEREREIKERERRLKDHEEREAQQARQQRTGQIIDLTQRVATKLGLTGEGDLEVAEQFVANKILQNVANGGKRDISDQELVAAVRRASKALAKEKEAARKNARAELQRKNLKAAKDRAKAPKRPAAPKSGSPSTNGPTRKTLSNKPQQDPLGSWLDDQIGVEQ